MSKGRIFLRFYFVARLPNYYLACRQIFMCKWKARTERVGIQCHMSISLVIYSLLFECQIMQKPLNCADFCYRKLMEQEVQEPLWNEDKGNSALDAYRPLVHSEPPRAAFGLFHSSFSLSRRATLSTISARVTTFQDGLL